MAEVISDIVPVVVASATSPNSHSCQMELLMEKLRTKSSGLKLLSEASKGLKQAILNRQHMLDAAERTSLGHCLDTLQQHIKINSLPAMLERLEAIARQLGLKFTAQGSDDVFFSCDMFYVEVLLDAEGKARDVKVELAGSPNGHDGQAAQSSPELMECLNIGDFADFMAHLEGFGAIYQLNADKKIKSKAYQALLALETDLTNLYELTRETLGDAQKLVLKSPVGIVQCRKGGHPMRLVYFVSPYELLDVTSGRAVMLTPETVPNLTHFVTVNIDSSTSHKLQVTQLMSITQQPTGQKLPAFKGLTPDNSITLPASFFLRLPKPMAVSSTFVKRISEMVAIEFEDLSAQEPLLPLIVGQARDEPQGGPGEVGYREGRGLFVSLPDQNHCYFMTNGANLSGVLLSAIPFTHPTHLVNILIYLRAQALFNELVASCVRPASKQDLDSSFVFEVTAISQDHLSVTFEHPQQESTATVEILLSEVGIVRCRLHTLAPDHGGCSEEHATKVLQRSHSIPVTMRSILKKILPERPKEKPVGGENPVATGLPDGGNDINMDPTPGGKLGADFGGGKCRRDVQPPPLGNPMNVCSNLPTPFPSFSNNSSGNLIANSTSGLNVSSVHNFNSVPITNVVSSSSVNVLSVAPNLIPAAPVQEQSISRSSYGPTTAQSQPQVAAVGLASRGNTGGLGEVVFSEPKSVKFRKKKSLDLDGRSPKTTSDDSCDYDYPQLSPRESLQLHSTTKGSREPSEKLLKRRLSDSSIVSDLLHTGDLAALREQVYGAGSAANYAKFAFNATAILDPTAKKPPKKSRTSATETPTTEPRKSPIVLDLTDSVDSATAKKATSAGSGGGGGGHLPSLSAALLKRPGIEIIPIPGSNGPPISIPSSITVTPVIKSEGSDKRGDGKDVDRREKKRKRDETGSPSGASRSSSGVQIITGKNSMGSSLDKFKNDNVYKPGFSNPSLVGKVSGYLSPTKKTSLSSAGGLGKSSIHSTKISLSPALNKTNKVYSPTPVHGTQSSPKDRTSPKPSSSPKPHPNMSPKHTSLGKPSMNALKSASPTFPKTSLLPKVSKNRDKDRISSPSRTTGLSHTSGSGYNTSGTSLAPKTKSSSGSFSSSDKLNTNLRQVKVDSNDKSKSSSMTLAEALTITKVSTGESASSSSLATSFLASPHPPSASPHPPSASPHPSSASPHHPSTSPHHPSASPHHPSSSPHLSSALDKAKASPPKNRKCSSLSDIVDKLRGAQGGPPGESPPGVEPKRKENNKMGFGESVKADSDKKSEFMVKHHQPGGGSTTGNGGGLRLTINKAKVKDHSRSSGSKSSSKSSSPSSGLKPGVASGPASKKLPPIPKLPPSSVASVTTSVSPLAPVSGPMVAPNSMQYNREWTSKDSRPPPIISKSRDSVSPTKPVMAIGGVDLPRKDSTGTTVATAAKVLLSRPPSREETRSIVHKKMFDATDSVEKNMSKMDLLRSNSSIDSPFAFSNESSTLDNSMGHKLTQLMQNTDVTAASHHAFSRTNIDSHETPHKLQQSAGCESNSEISTESSATSSTLMHPPPPKSDVIHSRSTPDMFSSNPSPPIVSYPPSPTLSVRIVKSPAPVSSPLSLISPHSVASQPSPCIIDDDLMDEALMGTRK